MTKTLQAAAQALLDAIDKMPGIGRAEDWRDTMQAYNRLRAAISAPPPSEEEAVKELMRLVQEFGSAQFSLGNYDPEQIAEKRRDAREQELFDAIEATRQSVFDHVRQMLRSAQEDARDAARYRTLRHSLTYESGSSHTKMPAIHDPVNSMITYRPEGLDDTLDEIMSERGYAPPCADLWDLLDDVDREVVGKLREAFANEHEPLRRFIDEDEIADACRLLIKVLDQ